jgi:hypothetical protein
VSLIALLGFGTVVLVAMLLLHGYLWWRLVRGTTRPGRARRRLTALTVLLAVLPAAAVTLRRTLPLEAAAPLDWLAYCWLGVAFYAFLTLLVLEPVRLVGNLWLRSRAPAPQSDEMVLESDELVAPSGARRLPDRGDEPAPPDGGTAREGGAIREDRSVVPRRLFLARGLAVTAGAVALGTAGTGAYFANGPPVVRRVPVTLAGLDPALEGLRIVTFSDGHLSATYGGRRFERLVELVNEQQPDVVAIVGDLVDGDVDELREEVAPLADLVSRQGVFFVTGNHEYFVDTRGWMRHLPTLGVDVLRNERVAIRRGDASFDLAGIDDRTAASSGVPGGPAALGTHARWPAVALRLRDPPGPAGRRGAQPARGHPALRHLGCGVLGAAHAHRGAPGGDGRGAARSGRLTRGQCCCSASKASSTSSSSLCAPLQSAQASRPAVYADR